MDSEQPVFADQHICQTVAGDVDEFNVRIVPVELGQGVEALERGEIALAGARIIALFDSRKCFIVDWKTNQIPVETAVDDFAVDLGRKYLPQLEAYRKVIERGFQKPVARLLIYSTVLGRFV